jgi:hypothetical protein
VLFSAFIVACTTDSTAAAVILSRGGAGSARAIDVHMRIAATPTTITLRSTLDLLADS